MQMALRANKITRFHIRQVLWA